MNKYHKEILDAIKANSGQGTKHTFLDSYLGNENPRYAINAPTLRTVAKEWKREHRGLTAKEFRDVVTSLIEAKSSTEKIMAGMLLDNADAEQKKFDPKIFDRWLNHLTGWAEVDTVCTGKYTVTEIPAQFDVWKKILTGFSKSKNINKRRASLVFLCSTLRHHTDPRLAALAFQNIDRLKNEKEILITKAISWLLRSMVKHHRRALTIYLKENESSLPLIAIRETKIKLETGTKSGRGIQST